MSTKHLKKGKSVYLNRRNGERVEGVNASDVMTHANGDWIDVNVGDKKNPKLIRARPSKVDPR